jgi:hypothetical protein
MENPESNNRCRTCGLDKPILCFYKNNKRETLYSCCKECFLRAAKIRQEKNRSRGDIIIPEFKACPGCSITKSSLVFGKNDNNSDGLNGYCKECEAERSKKRSKNNRTRELIAVPEAKPCPGCKIEKSAFFFGKNDNNGDGLQYYCKKCDTAYKRKLLYGASPEWINLTLDAQGGACAICKFIPGPGDKVLCLDHKHIEGWKEMPPEERRLYVRGLLCGSCNRGVGLFTDRIDCLGRAIEYLSGPTTGIVYKEHLAKQIKNKILVSQGYLCRICSVDLHGKRIHFDHDHLTNMVRGALCHCCNVGLGCFYDSIPILQSAIKYLEKYKTNVENVVEYTE